MISYLANFSWSVLYILSFVFPVSIFMEIQPPAVKVASTNIKCSNRLRTFSKCNTALSPTDLFTAQKYHNDLDVFSEVGGFRHYLANAYLVSCSDSGGCLNTPLSQGTVFAWPCLLLLLTSCKSAQTIRAFNVCRCNLDRGWLNLHEDAHRENKWQYV